MENEDASSQNLEGPKVDFSVMAKQITGCESAFNYFYGYLRFVLPVFKKQLIEETLMNDKHRAQKTVQKMLIIMPESCFCDTKLDSPNQIEFTQQYVLHFENRAGNDKRDYKSSLYKLYDEERQQEYYFVGELATPLLTMYETYRYGLFGMTKEQLHAAQNTFCHTLKNIFSHPDMAECNDQCILLDWSDLATGKANRQDLYNFLLPVLRKEIAERQNVGNSSETAVTNNFCLLPSNRRSLNTSETVPVPGCNPARAYDPNKAYPMNVFRPRGKCLIVNIVNFDQCSDLEPRKGAEKDEERIKKLFEYLNFEVQPIEKDISWDLETLKSRFSEMQNTDHTNYDAFVCCIMTHGKLGAIYTSDEKEVEILELAEYFEDSSCASLTGKPKMFFIQACQTGDDEPDNSAHGGSTEDNLALASSKNTASACAASVESLPFSTRETVEGVQQRISRNQNETSDIAVTEVEPAFKTDAFPDLTPSTLKHMEVYVPRFPDFLMSYSTLPWSVSYRDEESGSLYIQALDECIRKYRGHEIDRVLKMVTCSVKEKLEQEPGGATEGSQLPFHLTSGMHQSIYL